MPGRHFDVAAGWQMPDATSTLRRAWRMPGRDFDVWRAWRMPGPRHRNWRALSRVGRIDVSRDGQRRSDM